MMRSQTSWKRPLRMRQRRAMLEEIIRQQGKGPVLDISELHGGFWPEEESMEEFLAALYEWRGRHRVDRAGAAL